MVVVYVGTVDRASTAGLPQPVQLAVRGHSVDQRKAGQGSAVQRKNNRKIARLRAAQQGLPGEEAEHGIGKVEKPQRCRVVRVRAHAEDELRDNEQAKYCHGKKQGIPPDLHFAFENLLADP